MKPFRQAILARSLCKTYEAFTGKLPILNDLDFEIDEGQFMILSGPSGSGKTTLLNIIGGIDRPTTGKIFVYGEDLTNKSEDFLADFRCNNIGHVFQSYNLVSTLTVAENITFPMEWLRKPRETIEDRAKELLDTLGLQTRAEHFPSQLSGGEQQRVAFARALANDPRLILADEPTGNLDKKTGDKIVQLLRRLKDDKRTLVVVTHDASIIKFADRKFYLEQGKLLSRNE